MEMRFPYMSVDRFQSIRWTFVLRENTSNARKRTLRLPPIVMDGSNKRQMYQRSLYFKGEEIANDGAYAVIKSDPELIQFLPYRQRVAYRSWMSNCQLLLVQEQLDYNGNLLDSQIKVLQQRMTIRRTAASSSNQTGSSRSTSSSGSTTSRSSSNASPTARSK
jgi:hypothetical protein